ncbi:NmrA/HSCARG family protein [Microbispora sp. ATCC PTA-5024]|uniref:NmrA/HSCARG family protein n=1 Tax=Microbispora sp. ATCC PTA-5024 TaxID=316330 RepID=UPI0003DB7998|nr:NmrA/HSCARG family protein [Microbispora sp. ATCC PTA-5024]ETK37533.1 NmrA family transcriptional regulator [Microbispora sp. ATCC PTA-5024]
MPRSERTILVTGATGNQGGAAARRLLADGWRVRALVRDPSAPAARALAEAGAEPVAGDMLDRASLDAAMAGAYGVFSVQPSRQAPHFLEDEVRMGVNVADAAHAAGAGHIVYTSVGGADRDTGVSHWETKWEIERHIRGLGLRATVLRPVMFMENHASPEFGVFADKALIRIIPAGARVQLIAVTDIGAFAGLAFADPDRYAGQAFELAGDELTRAELVDAIARAVGRRLETGPVPKETLAQLGMNTDDLERVESFGGWRADIPALRALHPGLMTFGTWLEREGAARFRALLTGRPA